MLGAVWGLPIMLAATVQARFVRKCRPVVGSGLAARLREMMALHRPAMRIAALVRTGSRCANPACQQMIAQRANFCPRCGRRAAGPIDRVA
jgi:hypothetical protein